MRYSAAVSLLHIEETHQGLFAVILITAVTDRGNQIDGVRLQKFLSKHSITSTGDRERLEENLDISDLDEIAAEYLTGLT